MNLNEIIIAWGTLKEFIPFDTYKPMYKRLNNDWDPKEDEILLQDKFLKITNIYTSDGDKFPGKVCYNFLKLNKNLL